MKRDKIIYWVATGLISIMMLMSGGIYLVNTEEVTSVIEGLGFPGFITLPLGIAKLIGVVIILTRRPTRLLEWAYAGFFFDFILAFMAHWHANDGGHDLAAIALVLLMISYFFEKRI
ncbi:DoxX-like family protein [Reichenbachiella faecimaris]|uniref:DoxX-like family protein n=1 Tax=Reichenbachiella faecimaris TaxID=692418 RepID=A0A1W2GCD9_REIFA|nr:DoxX family protein [Reichenbachiella faecimaris]SMD33956.1 DoxX-like family protein [Reichenbachiella faecimaris]